MYTENKYNKYIFLKLQTCFIEPLNQTNSQHMNPTILLEILKSPKPPCLTPTVVSVYVKAVADHPSSAVRLESSEVSEVPLVSTQAPAEGSEEASTVHTNVVGLTDLASSSVISRLFHVLK